MSLLKELWTVWGTASYKHRAPNGAKNRCHPISPAINDNRSKLMYKGEAKQISPTRRGAYARLTRI